MREDEPTARVQRQGRLDWPAQSKRRRRSDSPQVLREAIVVRSWTVDGGDGEWRRATSKSVHETACGCCLSRAGCEMREVSAARVQATSINVALISATVPVLTSRLGFAPCLELGYRMSQHQSDSKCLQLLTLFCTYPLPRPSPARDPIPAPHVVPQHVPAFPSRFRARRAPRDPARGIRLQLCLPRQAPLLGPGGVAAVCREWKTTPRNFITS